MAPSFAGIDRLRIADTMLATFARHRMPPVVGFVNGKKVDEDPATGAVVARWVAAGQPLGNHTHSHPSLNKTPLADYVADIERGEAILQAHQPRGDWRLFRYPFLKEGDTLEKRRGVREYLRAHGYTIAEVTIDGDDWAFNPPFGRCTERGDTAAIAQLRDTFVHVHVSELRAMRDLTRAIAGHDVPQVLLLHIGAADAAFLDDLLTAYEAAGVHPDEATQRTIGFVMGYGLDETPDRIGDGALFDMLLELGRGGLLTVEGDGRAMRATRFQLTELGRAVLEGRANRVAEAGFERWIGGTHVDAASGRSWWFHDGALQEGPVPRRGF